MARRAFRFIAPTVLLLLAATLALPAAAQTFDEALAAAKRGDYATAYRGFRRLAEQGHASAQNNLGNMYAEGHGVQQDHAEAVKWYRRAAKQGESDAQNNLGYMYEEGQGVSQDYVEAAKWYGRAAEQGDAYAQINLGRMYAKGYGVRQDYAEAAKWYRLAAEQGHASAQNSLGRVYYNGWGVAQDYVEAAKWFRRAAEQGLAAGQVGLGYMYERGRGVPQDYAKAVKWYRRAAKHGEAYAQNSLGIMYDSGRGVPQDYAEAAKWYRRAAGQGYAYAQNNLGNMYEGGKGIPRDPVQAHKWFNLAASRAAASDKKLRERAVVNRDRVAAQLTGAQLARAQRLARVWRPRTGAADSTPPAAGGDDRRRVAAVQRALAQLGYDPGPADGIAGPKTRNAVRAFQAAAGLPVDGRVSEGLERTVLAALRRAGPAPRPALEKTSTGSGFRVSAGGDILTNAHVVDGCIEVRIPPPAGGPARRVAVAARDRGADLALLKGPAGLSFAAFRQGRGVRPGARIVVMGYPLRGLLAADVNVSTGTVAALAGPGDDRRLIQITAPVQPGNSGGPVLDAAGNVVGAVVAKLNALKVARATGDIPQNVNFAVSAGAARAFLDSKGVAYTTAPSAAARSAEDVADAARKFTVLVECWK
ncbi:MAG: hypothetical protein F4114_15320 [Rhodospirillaceae bacterium]|nr:hypothetical protein [Rhodospirillaceae bacterium]MYB12626.1 hypothetical protein [Rhodospirillaceae bacterium]MYI50441.1 hypothetical protein [Rhodospirillaceae bacterium]